MRKGKKIATPKKNNKKKERNLDARKQNSVNSGH